MYLEQTRQHWRLDDFAHDALSKLYQLSSSEFEALLNDVAAEFLLRQVCKMSKKLFHDCCICLRLAKFQYILQAVVAKAVLQGATLISM